MDAFTRFMHRGLRHASLAYVILYPCIPLLLLVMCSLLPFTAAELCECDCSGLNRTGHPANDQRTRLLRRPQKET